MKAISRVFWGALALLIVLWTAFNLQVFEARGFFALRSDMVQLTGILAVAAMSFAMVLALRPRWPEARFGGLDKMYRLHKWFGIAALVLAVVHWLWAKGPKWAVGYGLLSRPERGPRPEITNPLEQLLSSQRGTAEGLGVWAFYAVVLLIVLALVPRFPYRQFYKTHKLIAIAYLVLVFHSVVLVQFSHWTTPIGIVVALLLIPGTYAALIALTGRIGAGRQVHGTICLLRRYPGVRALESEIAMEPGSPGHKTGQFAFATSDAHEGAHPYTIASAWDPADPRITFVTKALGDHTSLLADKLSIGQRVKVEGPYGCFTFDDDRPRQIWVGGGIGITPFISRMKYLARAETDRRGQVVDLFHTTADVDEDALARLAEDAKAADVRLHILVDARHGRLSGARIREAVPDWREASIWFCGPTGFGKALRTDLAAHGFDVEARFHQELFSMR